MDKNFENVVLDLIDMGFTANDFNDFRAFGFTDEEIRMIAEIMADK